MSNIKCKPCDLFHQCVKRAENSFCTTCLYFEHIEGNEYVCLKRKQALVDITNICPPTACCDYEELSRAKTARLVSELLMTPLYEDNKEESYSNQDPSFFGYY